VETEDYVPPVTPATAMSVLPLHAAVAAGKLEDVRVWLDVYAPLPPAVDAASLAEGAGGGGGIVSVGASGVSTPEWPPRPVSDMMGPESALRDGPSTSRRGDGVIQGGRGEGGAGRGGGDGGEGGGGGEVRGSEGPHARPGFSELWRRGGDSGGAAYGPSHHLLRFSDRSSAGGGGGRRGPVDVRNEHGNTALAVAAALTDASVAATLVTLLMEHGASPLVLSGGWTPPHWVGSTTP